MARQKRRGEESRIKSANTIVVPETTPPLKSLSQTTIETFEASVFEGPLPSPKTLAEYESTCPGIAGRLVAMAENQATHRQKLEEMVVRSNCRAQDRGPILGFLLAAGVIGLGFYLILRGKEVSGLVAIIGALTTIVATFVYGKRRQTSEIEEKRKQLVSPPGDWEYSVAPDSGPSANQQRSLKESASRQRSATAQ